MVEIVEKTGQRMYTSETRATHQGQLQVWSQTTLLSGSLAPSKMGEFGIGGNTDDLSTNRGEFLQGRVKSEDLSWTDD